MAPPIRTFSCAGGGKIAVPGAGRSKTISVPSVGPDTVDPQTDEEIQACCQVVNFPQSVYTDGIIQTNPPGATPDNPEPPIVDPESSDFDNSECPIVDYFEDDFSDYEAGTVSSTIPVSGIDGGIGFCIPATLKDNTIPDFEDDFDYSVGAVTDAALIGGYGWEDQQTSKDNSIPDFEDVFNYSVGAVVGSDINGGLSWVGEATLV